MNKSLRMNIKLHFPVQMRDSCPIPLKLRNRQRICLIGKPSGLLDPSWAGITSPLLKLIIPSLTNPNSCGYAPGRLAVPEIGKTEFVAEGYPSRSQDSAGLKRDQFIKLPKSQEKWYKMHLLKSDGPHRPGRSAFNWRNTEANVNSQFLRITRASAYPSTGPPSRPIAQEALRRWERAAREDSYIINHADGFSRGSTELQDKKSQNIALLCCRLNKGKAPKDVSNALNDLRDLMAFHQRVSVAMGTSLQHLADSLFVHMSNMILLRRDSYLDFVKPGVKQDTMNLLRNAPMFGYGLFPDAAIMSAEQDIQKHETSSVAQGPGPGASQHTSWRGSHRYRPYDRKDRKPTASSEQVSQQQHQPWRQFSSSWSRGRGRGSNPRFSKSQAYKPYK